MTIRTKIICTIGPACSSFARICELINAGMNVARLNFSHGTHEKHLETINTLKEAREKLNVPLAIMLDTSGPEVRIGEIRDGSVSLTVGAQWKLVKEKIVGDESRVSVFPSYLLDTLPVGTKILFDDGYISSVVVGKDAEGLIVEIEHGGVISSGKGVNIPNVELDLPAVTEKDIADIRFACEHQLEIIAASFVRSPENVITVKNLVQKYGCPDTLIIAKIENNQGVVNFDSILQVADGVMIARGDLGVEVPLSRVPRLQKEMIKKCYMAGKPSITATQMLESMISNPRPTRAEVSDVANAIYDSTSSVMLSGETAVGKFPVRTVHVMKSIIKETESDFNYREFFDRHSIVNYHDVPSSVTLATVKTAYSSHAKAIFAFTSQGGTARLLSRLRPEIPIIAMTPKLRSYHQMALNWGVIPFFGLASKNMSDAFEAISLFALDKQLVSYGDLVVVTAGSTFGVSGTTNMMVVENIGDVLIRGFCGRGEKVHGNVCIVFSVDGFKAYSARGNLVVIPRCDPSYLPIIEESIGVILQNHMDDDTSESYLLEVAEKIGKPVIVRADAASVILKQGQLVTLDPEKALVYKGVVL